MLYCYIMFKEHWGINNPTTRFLNVGISDSSYLFLGMKLYLILLSF